MIIFFKQNKRSIPRQHYEAVQPVPRLREVAPLPGHSHRDRLDEHLHGEVQVYDVVAYLQKVAPFLFHFRFEGQKYVCVTFSILHLLVSQSVLSSQGWNIPRVTQFSRITVIVRRSNHLEEKNINSVHVPEKKENPGLLKIGREIALPPYFSSATIMGVGTKRPEKKKRI